MIYNVLIYVGKIAQFTWFEESGAYLKIKKK